MSKRLIQEGKPGEEERALAKSKPMWNFMLRTVDRSPIALDPSASHSPGTLKAQSSNTVLTSTRKPVARGLNEKVSVTFTCQSEHLYR